MMFRFLTHSSLVVFIFFAVVGTASAVSDTFRITTLIGDDATPPSIPQNLTATPVATSQIDLAWDASTDDFIFGGYQIFRDDVQIATTTSITYSDSGLTPSTTYSYYVTAFDSFFNYSASSTPVATTTLASTTPPTPTTTPSVGGSGGGGELIEMQPVPIVLTKLEVIPATTSAIIRFETEGYVRAIVRWGRTNSYELGSSAERSFSRVHETSIYGLLPGTKYQFTIEGENHLGLFGVLTVGDFTTLEPNDVTPPPNVENLRAIREGNDIILSWINPSDPDFRGVRVVRNDLFYPSDTQDGKVVYLDRGELVRDVGAAEPGMIQYYTVFSYDYKGNISSGAIVALRVLIGGDAEVVEVIDVIDETKNELDLSFDMLEFVQDYKTLNVNQNDQVLVDGSKPLTIRIPYTALPEHLKTILVTLTDTTDSDKTFQFLLRIDEDKEYYTATLAPLGVAGVFPVRLAIFDFKTQQVGYTKGGIVSTISFIPTREVRQGFFSYLLAFILSKKSLYMFLFLLLLLILFLLGKRLLAHKEE